MRSTLAFTLLSIPPPLRFLRLCLHISFSDHWGIVLRFSIPSLFIIGNLYQIILHNTSKLDPFLSPLSYQYHISCCRFCNAWLILALDSLFGLMQEIPVQYMEEESSFFDRERDRLSREITAVRKHNGLLKCGLKCAYRDLKNYYPQAMP